MNSNCGKSSHDEVLKFRSQRLEIITLSFMIAEWLAIVQPKTKSLSTFQN